MYVSIAQEILLYHYFLHRTVAFIKGSGLFVTSHSVLMWYFKHAKTSIESRQIVESTKLLLRYHTGTIAFGSLLLAVVQFLRIILTYVQQKLEKKDPTKLLKCLFCCCQCCLWCLEKFIKFVDKHAYIQCAMNGKNFCHSARRAFGLLFRNMGRVATLSVLSNLVIVVGKISVTLTCAGIAYYYMRYHQHSSMNGYVVPTLFTGLIAYISSSVFLDVISITSDTLLQVIKMFDDSYLFILFSLV